MRAVRTLVVAAAVLALTGCGGKKKGLQATQLQILATNKLGQGDAEGALADLSQAHKLKPKNAEITNLLGLAYWAKYHVLGDEALLLDAEKYVRESFDQVGESKVPGDWRNNLGALYIDMKRYPDAVVQLQMAIKDPEYRTPERPYNNLCKASLEQRKYPEAEDYCSKALRAQPKFCMALLNRGISYQEQKKLAPALDDLKNVQGECPEWPEPYLRAGKVLLAMNRKAEAVAMLQQAKKHDPDGPFGKEADHLIHY